MENFCILISNQQDNKTNTNKSNNTNNTNNTNNISNDISKDISYRLRTSRFDDVYNYLIL